MKGSKVGIISDLRLLDHRAKPRHPESPARVKAILRMLQAQKLLDNPRVDYISKYDRTATDDDIRLIYPQSYIEYLHKLWPEGETRVSIPLSDSYCSQHTEAAARISAGGVLEGIDQVMSGAWSRGFCVVRPPGHHSGEKGKINGFCVLNNVALGARYLESRHNVSRIAILDYDVHEGDGTHHIFDSHKDVLFISVHRHDRGTYYPSGPGGNFPNCGKGEAEGTKLNIPLNTINRKRRSYDFQAPGDNEYIYLYNRIIHPILKEFDPEFILVSSGFDAARKDYLGGFTVTPNGYYFMTRRLLQLGKPLLCVLQGGYHLGSTAQAATAVVRGLLEEEALPEPVTKGIKYENIHLNCHLQPQCHADLDEIIEHHSKYWKSLLSEDNVAYSTQIKKNQEKLFGVFEEESSSSSSEEEQQVKEGEETQQETPLQEYSRHEVEDSNNNLFKDFSYTNTRVLKLTKPAEAMFYESKFPERRFTPKYFGQKGNYLVLENILYKKKGGEVVEVKLSRQSLNSHLPAEVIQREAKKESQSTSERLSFRISAITNPQHKENCLLIDDEGTVKKILRRVVDEKSKPAITAFLSKLAGELRNANRLYFGSSILLIKGKEDSSVYWTNIYNWYPHDTYDASTIEGIENLLKFIESLE